MTKQGDGVRFAVDMGFFMCGNDLFSLDLPMCEKLVYIALCRYAGSNNRAWPSYATLCKDVSCSRTRVIAAVRKLCLAGLIKKEPRGNRTNVYSLYPAANFQPCFDCFEKTQKAACHSSPGEPPKDRVVHEAHPHSPPGEPEKKQE